MFSSEWAKKYTRTVTLSALAYGIVGMVVIILYCMLKAPVYNAFGKSIKKNKTLGWMIGKKSSTTTTMSDYACVSAAFLTLMAASSAGLMVLEWEH